MNDETTPPPDDSTLPDDELDAATIPSEPVAAESVPVDAAAESGAAVDAEDDAVEAEEEFYDADDEYAAPDDGDDEDEYDLDDSLTEDELDTAPNTVDWAAMAGAGAGVQDLPDLTLGGAGAMDVDIDAALAAVDTLGAVVAAEQERKREEADRREAARRADEEYRRWAESYVFRRPGMIRVQGGRVVTILPAVALMAVGAVLTLATSSGQAMTWQTLAAAASAGLSMSLLSYWLASGRWARGALFAALLVATGGAWVFLETLPNVTLSWTLPFIGLGAAFALTGLLGRPRAVSWMLVGLGIIAGAVAMPLLSQRFLTTAAPFVLAAAVIFALLPTLFRVRRS